jgi:CheY-like chemotaxis protein
MVSAADMEDCRQQGAIAGIQGFLIKPVTRSLLFDTIVRIFAKEKSGIGEEILAIAPEQEGDGTDIDGQESLRGARILLVEDNEINQQIAVELLQQVGSVVTTANNGKEALDILQQQEFDAVLMDIQMPIMDGLEAARRARDLPVAGIRALPILAMTAHAMESDRDKSLQVGMQEHLTKPIDPVQMYAVLSKWIRLGKSSPLDIPPPGAATLSKCDHLPGLDVQNALKHLGGDEGLYIKLLTRFVESYEYVPQQIRDALTVGDRQLAVRLAHTVRGLAASLGASSLTSVAGDLERILTAKKDHAVMLEQMREVLRQTIESIRIFLQRV